MQIGRLGSLVGFSIGLIGAGIQMVVPEPRLYGWILIGIGALTVLISFAWWFFAHYKLQLPWILRANASERHVQGVIASKQNQLGRKIPLIDEAREFVSHTLKEKREYSNFKDRLEIEPVYLKLRPYLSDKFRKDMANNRLIIVVDSDIPGIALAFLRELDRLEKEWNS